MLLAIKQVWSWVKAHLTLVGGLLIALVGFLLGVSVRKRPVLVTGEDPAQKQEENTTEQEEQQVQVQAQQEQQKVEQQHQQDVQSVVTKEQQQEPALVVSEDGTNKYLQDVGQQVRGGSGDGGSG